MIGLCKSNGSEVGHEFLTRWQDSCIEAQRHEDKWIEMLRKDGIKAAHPDDGWVNRQDNKVVLCYPQFNDGVSIGDRICLGWHDKWRIVTITSIEQGLTGLKYYHFDTRVNVPSLMFENKL